MPSPGDTGDTSPVTTGHRARRPSSAAAARRALAAAPRLRPSPDVAMTAGRRCWPLLVPLLLALGAALAAAEPAALGVRVSPPRLRVRDRAAEEGSGDGGAVEDADEQEDVTLLKPETKEDRPERTKILDGTGECRRRQVWPAHQ